MKKTFAALLPLLILFAISLLRADQIKAEAKSSGNIPQNLEKYYQPLTMPDDPANLRKTGAFPEFRKMRLRTDLDAEVLFTYLGSAAWNGMKDVCVSSNYAFCSYNYGLQILDISALSEPQFESQVFLPEGDGWHLEYLDGRVFLADGYGGLQIIDVSDPANPFVRDHYDTPGYCYDVLLMNELAFVADGPAGVRVLDLTNPAGITEIGYYDPGFEVVAIKGRDTYLYLATRMDGLKIIDISDPRTPFKAAELGEASQLFDLDLAGEHVYLADQTAGLRIVNISNPLEPLLVAAPDSKAGALGVAVSGDYAYVTYGSQSGLQIYSIADPSSARVVNTLPIPGSTLGVAVSGNAAFVAGWYSGLQIIDISYPGLAAKTGEFLTPGSVEGISCDGNYIFAARRGWQINQGRIQIFNAHTPNVMEFVGEIILDGPAATDIKTDGNYAYITDIYNGLLIADISDPGSPQKIGSLGLAGAALKLALSDDLACIGADSAGLQIVNISDKYAPRLISSYDNQGAISGLATENGYVYLADLVKGFQIIDIRTPSNPAMIAEMDTPGNARDIALSGNYAFLVDDLAGLMIYDISNPESPLLVANPAGQPYAVSITIEGDFGYVTNVFQGLEAYNIKNPAGAYLAGAYATPGYAWDAAVCGEKVFLADYYGIQALSIGRPLLALSSENLAFEADQDGSQPASQKLYIENSAVARLVWSIANSQPWLHYIPWEGTGEYEVEVIPNTEGLLQGLYYDTLWITANTANSPQYVVVELLLSAPNSCPEISELSAGEIDENSHLELLITARDADNTIPVLSAENLPMNAAFADNGNGSGTFKFDPSFEQSGQYAIQFIARDAINPGLVDSATLMITVRNVNRTPFFESAFEDTQINEGEDFELIIEASDPDHEPITLICEGYPENSLVFISPQGIVSFSLLADYRNAGQAYLIVFTARDQSGSEAKDTFNLSVANRQLVVAQIDPNPPASGIKDVLISDKIQVIFNEEIDPASLDGNISILSAKGDQLVYVYDSQNKMLLISNGEDFFSILDTIAITLLADITDRAGFPLASIVEKTLLTGVAVYPGDADNNGAVDERDLLPLGVHWESTGPQRGQEPDCSWNMHPAHQWETLSATYADIDGSGVINGQDLCGLAENWEMVVTDEIFAKSSEIDLQVALKALDEKILENMQQSLQDCPESPGRQSLLSLLAAMLGPNQVILPEQVELGQNFPNPFNPLTTIRYTLNQRSRVKLEIYDLRGRLVKTLEDCEQEPGQYLVVWDGTDHEGRPAASGIYFYRLKTNQKISARKMLLLK